jgi:NADH:ubiquinone oxidoreductase subunit F (NADH-binding)/(2Fe-2S) ferredoxin/NAD-dependent dihydropyrimidine dehydrogenase PreA subunit
MPVKTVLIGQGTCCIAAGAEQVYTALKTEIAQLGLADSVQVKRTGLCHGFCQLDPVVIIDPEGLLYSTVKVDDVPEITQSLLPEGQPVERLFYHHPATGEPIPHHRDITFYSKQQRTVLKNCGYIDPEEIDDYLAVGGYEALRKTLLEMSPEQVIDAVKRSGLRGLGGAGFPAGRKWEACRRAVGAEKYVICNADEGDPGSFQDRSMLEGDPHSVLEGMIIAGYAVGSKQGYIYVRAEYPLAVKRLQIAIAQARENGFLGKDILGSGFDFDVEIFQGAGAFVCGESTALVLSIEGKRGMPKSLPRPRTTEVGLWNKPTLLNNVKTFANICWIINKGADWFASKGTEGSKGTAIFSLAGKVANCGLIEVPMGITLREIIYEIGGGIPQGKAFKAVQTGGPSGGCLPASLLDTPIDFDSLTAAGSMMGSGGMIVLNEDDCMVDIAKYFLEFIQNESCGKCTPCREGTKRMLEILGRITSGKGEKEDIEKLNRLANLVIKASLCALGQTAPNPVLTTLRYFPDEYEEHIKHKRCPAGICRALIKYIIDSEKCEGCGLCLKACPLEAIIGEKRQPHRIIRDKCTQCGRCLKSCKFEAIVKE